MPRIDRNQKLSDLTVDQFEKLVSRVVEKTIEELLADPDRGLRVRPEVADRLLESASDVNAGRNLFSAEEVAGETGLEWK